MCKCEFHCSPSALKVGLGAPGCVLLFLPVKDRRPRFSTPSDLLTFLEARLAMALLFFSPEKDVFSAFSTFIFIYLFFNF